MPLHIEQSHLEAYGGGLLEVHPHYKPDSIPI